jgi:hypothetical protein
MLDFGPIYLLLRKELTVGETKTITQRVPPTVLAISTVFSRPHRLTLDQTRARRCGGGLLSLHHRISAMQHGFKWYGSRTRAFGRPGEADNPKFRNTTSKYLVHRMQILTHRAPPGLAESPNSGSRRSGGRPRVPAATAVKQPRKEQLLIQIIAEDSRTLMIGKKLSCPTKLGTRAPSAACAPRVVRRKYEWTSQLGALRRASAPGRLGLRRHTHRSFLVKDAIERH